MLKHFLLILFASALIVLATLYVLQRNLIYFPVLDKPEREAYGALDMQEVTVNTEDNLRLLAWYKEPKNHKPTILFLHGNAGHIGYRMPWIRKFLDDDYGVLLLEYRGYGGNHGTPTEKGLYLDAKAGIKYLLSKNINQKQIILFGESIGSAVAVHVATDNVFCGMILQSPFSSLKKVAKFHYPWVFLKLWDKYASEDKLTNIQSPILIVHGEQDDIVPLEHGKELYSRANEPKQILTYRNLHHNDLWNEDYYTKAKEFINSHCQE